MEAQKITKYRGTLYEASPVPLALESTGRVGPSAKTFIKRVGAQASVAVVALSVDLSFTVACGMDKLYANRLRRHHV